VAFGGQVHDHVGLVAVDDRDHPVLVGDVGLLEAVAPAVGYRVQGIEVARVGQLVDDQHLVRSVADQLAHDGRTDEAGPAGHKESLGHRAPGLGRKSQDFSEGSPS
jgi:hypothetical protein